MLCFGINASGGDAVVENWGLTSSRCYRSDTHVARIYNLDVPEHSLPGHILYPGISKIMRVGTRVPPKCILRSTLL